MFELHQNDTACYYILRVIKRIWNKQNDLCKQIDKNVCLFVCRLISHFMFDVPYPSPQRPRILVQVNMLIIFYVPYPSPQRPCILVQVNMLIIFYVPYHHIRDPQVNTEVTFDVGIFSPNNKPHVLAQVNSPVAFECDLRKMA